MVMSSAFFAIVCAGTAYWHLFHAADKFCESQLKTQCLSAITDVCTRTFLFKKHW